MGKIAFSRISSLLLFQTMLIEGGNMNDLESNHFIYSKLIKHSKFFDDEYYREKHKNLSSSIRPEEHYLDIGWREGDDPSSRFSTSEYLELNPDVKDADICPLLHYELYGKYEGRKIGIDSGDYKSLEIKRGRQRKNGIKHNTSLIEKNRGARILVILHLFYMSSWKEIKEYLRNLDIYGYDLIVSYTPMIVDDEVLKDITDYKPDARVLLFPNLGYDVGSFTELLAEIDLDKYDIIFKLQSKGVNRKRIFIYGEYMEYRDWFLYLYEGCLGPETVHITIDKLMNDPGIGLVAAQNLIVEDPPHKQNMVRSFMTEQGMALPDKYLFVAGTCFAVKSSAMRQIADMNLKVEMYQSAGRGFTLAHKMERVICLVVLTSGYEFYGNSVMRFTRLLRKINPHYWKMKHYSGMRLLQDKRFKLDDNFVFYSIEHRLVKKYELKNIKLERIKRRWKRKNIPLTKCAPYLYLVSGDPSVYEEYGKQNKELYKLERDRETFDQLIQSIEKNGLNEENVVVVNKNNIIMDGQHRCCYLLYKYGRDYEVPCLRIYETDSRTFMDDISSSMQIFQYKILHKGLFLWNKIKSL